MNPRTLLIVSNFVLYQIAWFVGVWSAAQDQAWIGALVLTSVIIVHLFRAPIREPELKLVGMALAVGLVFDSILVSQSWVRYESGMILPGLAPYWIVLMWGLFATLLNVTLRWMHGRWILAAFLGALAGPLAYYGGVRMGALEFGNTGAAVTALAIGWAALTPLMLALASRFDGYGDLLEKGTP